MHNLICCLCTIFIFFNPVFANVISVSPNSSGALILDLELNSYHTGFVDTLSYTNGVTIYIRKFVVAFTDGGSCRELYYISPDTSTVELWYEEKDSMETVYGNIEMGIMPEKLEYGFFSSTISSDTLWYKSKVFPSLLKNEFDSLANDYNSEDSVVCGKPFIHYYLYNSIGSFFPTDSMYRVPGFNTLFYGRSKVDNLNFKFQIHSVSELKGSASNNYCDYKFLWAVDSLGNGVFKNDSLVSVNEKTYKRDNSVKFKISNRTLTFNKPLKVNSEIKIYMPSGRRVCSFINTEEITCFEMPLSSGVYFCTISNREYFHKFRFILK